ncbi:MAG: hypothetical protein HGA49_11680 [Eubacteriaceae bacterium]|nr:hypothetical protein [Eubacteriaceae bacterium]
MRKYKFRGKRIDNGEWIYGGYFKNELGVGILTSEITPWQAAIIDEVIPETVGQYIGHKDIGGTEIYENDVLEHVKTKVRYKVIWNDEILGYTLEGEVATMPINQYRLGTLRVVKEESHAKNQTPRNPA